MNPDIKKQYHLQQAHKYIINGKIKACLLELEQINSLSNKKHQFFTLLSARYYQNEEENHKNIITKENYKVEQSRIIYALINGIEDEGFFSKKITLNKNNKIVDRITPNGLLKIYLALKKKKYYYQNIKVSFFQENLFFKRYYQGNGCLNSVLFFLFSFILVKGVYKLYQNPDMEQSDPLSYHFILLYISIYLLRVSKLLIDWFLIEKFKEYYKSSTLVLNAVNHYLKKEYMEANRVISNSLEVESISAMYELRSYTWEYYKDKSNYEKRSLSIQDINQAIVISDEQNVQLQYNKARLLLYNCEFLEALNVINNSLKLSSVNDEIIEQLLNLKGISLFAHGLDLMTNGLLEEAMVKFDKSLNQVKGFELAPHFVNIIEGCRFAHSGKYDDAIKCLDNVYYMYGWVEWIHELLGDFYVVTGQTDKAMRHYNALISDIPFHSKTIDMRTWGNPQVVKKRFKEKLISMGKESLIKSRYIFLDV